MPITARPNDRTHAGAVAGHWFTLHVEPVLIPSGVDAASSGIDTQGLIPRGLVTPSDWVTGDIVVEASVDDGASWQPVVFDGTAMLFTGAAADQAIVVDPVAVGFWPTLRFVSAADQTAQKTLAVVFGVV